MKEGFCDGPFSSQQVTEQLGTDEWIPLRRFGIEQKTKIRGVDDASDNLVNSTSSREEKLEISSVDRIIATARYWETVLPGIRLGAWALDERKAYRTVPVHPEQRRFSVVAIVNPNKDNEGIPHPYVEYYIMNGHCFGFTNAVYNYCRRPLALRFVLREIFGIMTDDYVDDRWGIEPRDTIESSYRTTVSVTRLLGIQTQDDKAQGPPETIDMNSDDAKEPWTRPELLGVIIDLDRHEAQIKPKRRELLLGEINAILEPSCRKLSPGQASKLRGKLQFTTSTLFGRTGRAYMRALAERQYENAKRGLAINEAIEEALRGWLHILENGRPRPIPDRPGGPADAVIFTDGSSERDVKTIGGVFFAWWREAPSAFSSSVTKRIVDHWIPRKSDITMVELLAVVLAVYHYGPEVLGKRVIILIDSQAALDALIKGYSRKDDTCHLITVFWTLVHDHNITVYLDRVSTDANISDGVSRSKVKEAIALGWEIEHPDIEEVAGTDSAFGREKARVKRRPVAGR